jgi:hypothetical protein
LRERFLLTNDRVNVVDFVAAEDLFADSFFEFAINRLLGGQLVIQLDVVFVVRWWCASISEFLHLLFSDLLRIVPVQFVGEIEGLLRDLR